MKSFNLGRVNPSFMIIGAQKGGTSSLYYYLAQHPKLIAPVKKELHYFDTFKPTPSCAYSRCFPKSYFTTKKSFEATPRYIYYPGTAKKISEYNPKMKFIVMLRDPAKRAFSAWNMYGQLAKNKSLVNKSEKLNRMNDKEQQYSFFFKGDFPSFEDCVEYELSESFDSSIIEPSIIRRGYYKEQIEEYLKYFELSSFLFIDFDMFKNETIKVLNEVSDFLSIERFDRLKINLKPQNKRDYSVSLNNNLYLELSKHYFLKNKGLEDLVNLRLPWMHIENNL